MSSKVLMLFAVLCLLSSCCGDEDATRNLTRHEDIPIEPLGVSSEPDFNEDASFWRFWKFWKWGRSMLKKVFTHSSRMAESASAGRHRHRIHEDRPRGKLKNKVKFLFKIHQYEKLIMYYLDSQKTVTRRDSSLVAPTKLFQIGDDKYTDFDLVSSVQAPSTTRLTSESGASLVAPRIKGSVRKEVITSLFESMLESIVDSWEVIMQQKSEEIYSTHNASESNVTGKKKKPIVKSSKTKKSRSTLDLGDNAQVEPLHQIWWTGADERVIIRFKNGNLYEGNISMKCMNGEGRFQWADGTIYLGEFKDNEMRGKGMITWKDDTWYQGDFLGNLRHGKGLYVDSRRQRSYTGGWHCGTKHGQGLIHYSKSFKNSYDGEWIHNVRHGFGTREYCSYSGYKGEWDMYVREGKGLMIWPNHDFYKGDWKNGVMSGYGMYIWNVYFNNSMSLPSINAYRGYWQEGERNGYGLLNLGLGLGSHYKGEFVKNKKHGAGKFVTNNGQIIRHQKLFNDDNFGSLIEGPESTFTESKIHPAQQEPFHFSICDSSLGLGYHIEEALKHIDKQEEIRNNMINDFITNNKNLEVAASTKNISEKEVFQEEETNIDDLIYFEEISLRNAVRCYEAVLKHIYYTYATICNSEEISFTPVMMRLYLWQFYYDCNIHSKGLTLVEIDRIFHRNPEWLSRTPHCPFEKVYFWQFLHSLISISSQLYAKTQLPGPKPDTILASAFRTFMEKDAIPSCGNRHGNLTKGFGSYIPLKGLYELYQSLGEPHTVRRFICAVRQSPHLYMDLPQPGLAEASDECIPLGRNVYVFGDEMSFITDEVLPICEDEDEQNLELQLFNFGNISTKALIKVFADIFPQLCEGNKIMDLDIELTFYEFFEAFVACAEESIQIKEEELRWREKFSAANIQQPPQLRPSHVTSTPKPK